MESDRVAVGGDLARADIGTKNFARTTHVFTKRPHTFLALTIDLSATSTLGKAVIPRDSLKNAFK